MRGSQNGFDNSGDTGSYKWVSTLSTGGAARYTHWEIRGANWIGDFNQETQSYDNINYDNIQHGINVVRALVERHKNDEVVVAMEPGI
jgi:hypothetical protein